MSIKKLIISILSLVLVSCGGKDPAPNKACQANSVVNFDKAFTRFDFQEIDSKLVLNTIKVYDGTDSAYVYTYHFANGQLSTIAYAGVGSKKLGESKLYNATYDGTNLAKLTVANKEEIRLVYNNSKIAQSQSFLANNVGTMFQVGHEAFTYDGNGNLTQSQIYVDLVSLFTIAFGSDPTSYSPILFTSVVIEPSTYPNPLKDHVFIDNLALSLMNKMPQKITYKDLTGNPLFTDSYSFTTDSNGQVSRATAGTKYVEATYVCK